MRVEETKNNYMTKQPDYIEGQLISFINAYFKTIDKDNLDDTVINKLANLIAKKVKTDIYTMSIFQNESLLKYNTVILDKGKNKQYIINQNQNVSKIMLTIEDKRYIIKNYGTTYIENKNEIIAITMYLSYENSVIILIDNRTSHEISFDLEIFK